MARHHRELTTKCWVGCSAWLDLSDFHRASEQIILPNDIVLKIRHDQRVVFSHFRRELILFQPHLDVEIRGGFGEELQPLFGQLVGMSIGLIQIASKRQEEETHV